MLGLQKFVKVTMLNYANLADMKFLKTIMYLSKNVLDSIVFCEWVGNFAWCIVYAHIIYDVRHKDWAW